MRNYEGQRGQPHSDELLGIRTRLIELTENMTKGDTLINTLYKARVGTKHGGKNRNKKIVLQGEKSIISITLWGKGELVTCIPQKGNIDPIIPTNEVSTHIAEIEGHLGGKSDEINLVLGGIVEFLGEYQSEII
jgi:hypothetical protein